MKLTLGVNKVKIRFLYKSGNSHEEWFKTFSTDGNFSSAEWETTYQNYRPIAIGLKSVEAVWQVDYRINLFYFLWANIIGPFVK